jgi:hypothetical protein
MKIENGTQKQFFRKVRRWDPLKTVPGSCFEKACKINEKTIGKSVVLDNPKPLKSIEKQKLFFTSTRARGGPWDTPGQKYTPWRSRAATKSILWRSKARFFGPSGRHPKIMIFWHRSKTSKIRR